MGSCWFFGHEYQIAAYGYMQLDGRGESASGDKTNVLNRCNMCGKLQYKEYWGKLHPVNLEKEPVRGTSAGTRASKATDAKDGKQQENKTDNAENVANGS